MDIRNMETPDAKTMSAAAAQFVNAKQSGEVTEPLTNFIPNPLPVPKRVSRQELNYDYDVPEDQMHYDIPVRDNDRFDVE